MNTDLSPCTVFILRILHNFDWKHIKLGRVHACIITFGNPAKSVSTIKCDMDHEITIEVSYRETLIVISCPATLDLQLGYFFSFWINCNQVVAGKIRIRFVC